MKLFLIYFLLIITFFSGFGQQKFTVSEVVSDEESGEVLIGASIYNSSNESKIEGGAIRFFGSVVPSDSVLFIYPQDNP